MKRIMIVLALMAMVFCVSCKKDKDENANSVQNNTQRELTVSDLNYTDCLNHVDPDPDKEKPADWDSVYINYYENSMQVNIHNFGVPCCFDRILASSEITNDTIGIKMGCTLNVGPSCSCMVDVSFKLEEVPTSGTYKIIVYVGNDLSDADIYYEGLHTF